VPYELWRVTISLFFYFWLSTTGASHYRIFCGSQKTLFESEVGPFKAISYQLVLSIFGFIDLRQWFVLGRMCVGWRDLVFGPHAELLLWDRAPFLVEYQREFKRLVGTILVENGALGEEAKPRGLPIEYQRDLERLVGTILVESDAPGEEAKPTGLPIQECAYIKQGVPPPAAFVVRHLHAIFKQQGIEIAKSKKRMIYFVYVCCDFFLAVSI
jgi:hypothetical protein